MNWLAKQWDSPRVKLARLLPRVSTRLTAVVVTLGVIGALIGPATILARGALVGSIQPTLRAGGFTSSAGGATLFALGLVAALFILQMVVRSMGATLITSLSLRVDQHLEQRAIRALCGPYGIAHLEGPEIANSISLLQGVGTAGYRPGNAVDGLITRVQTWLSGLGSALILAGFRWWVALALSMVYIWAARVTLRDYMVLTKLSSGQAPTIRKSHYFRDLAFIPAAAKEIRVFGLADWLIDRFKEFWYEAMGPIWNERSNRFELGLASTAMSVASIAAAVFVGFAAINGEFGIGSAAIFLGAIGGLYDFGSGYGPGDIQLQYGLAVLPGIEEIENLAKPNEEFDRTLTVPSPFPADSIRFESVRFTYPGTGKEILSSIDLTIPANKATAIVGLNGAGKTTIVKLLCRFYEPDGGEILIDNTGLRTLHPEAWQRRVAAVFQDFVRYELSAADNISLGAIHLEDRRELIEAVIDRARARDLIDGLPKGLETVLSREVTDGVQISGGEWQRLVLARALYAIEGGARVLVLDEPTAALDVRAEAEIYRSFLEITKGITTVLISHRFSTVRLADLIHVIENGRVIESGNHEELLAKSGTYAHLFNLQASRFVEIEEATRS